MLRVHFKDDGQDCQWWDIDNDGIVQDCNLQGFVWKGTKVLAVVNNSAGNNHKDFVDVQPGDELICQFKSTMVGRFIHPVDKVEKR
jgi:hypothetical protein